MADVPSLEKAWLKVKDGLIEGYGAMDDFQEDNAYETVSTSKEGWLRLLLWILIPI